MGSSKEFDMKVTQLFLFAAAAFAKPQTDSGSSGTTDTLNAITDFAALFGGLQGDATSQIVTEALKFVSKELLPAIQAMQADGLTTVELAEMAGDLVVLTGERIARATFSYAQNVDGTDAPQAGSTLAYVNQAGCILKFSGEVGREVAKVVIPYTDSTSGKTFEFSTDLIGQVLEPITLIAADIMKYETDTRCYTYDE